jgi:lipopolysaccharide export system protein LptA
MIRRPMAVPLGVPLAAALLLGVAAAPAGGQGIDLSQGGPVEVTATDGIEWRQAEQVVIARGSARAVRDGVTVDADRLLARYRQPPGRQPATGAAVPGESPLAGGGEIWRLEAEGRVTIRTATDTARGDRAVYDIDQAVLVLTGQNLGLTSGANDITARDSLEYWSARRMAVARGGAVVNDRAEGRRVTADTLVAYFLEDPARAPAGATQAAARPAPRVQTAEGRDVPGAGRLDRVEAFGNVEIRTATDVVRGERGVYSAATGMARILGNVRITRGENQINGQEAIVNLRTGVARLVSAPGARVQGLVLPQSQGGEDPTAPRGGARQTQGQAAGQPQVQPQGQPQGQPPAQQQGPGR